MTGLGRRLPTPIRRPDNARQRQMLLGKIVGPEAAKIQDRAAGAPAGAHTASEQPFRLHRTPLREAELDREGLGHELGEERATEERTAHDIDGVVPQLGRPRHNERRDCLKIREERVQIQPEDAVVAGLQAGVATPSLGQTKEGSEPRVAY